MSFRPMTDAPATLDRIVRLGVIVALLWACLAVLKPFLGALTWGAIIAVTLFPAFARMEQAMGQRTTLAASLMGLALLALLAVPLGLIAMSAIDSINLLLELEINLDPRKPPPLPDWLVQLPIVGPEIAKSWKYLLSHLGEVAKQMAPAAKDATLWLLRKGSVAGLTLFEFVVAIVVAAVLLASHRAAGDAARRFAIRVAGERGGHMLQQAGRTVRGVSMGVMGTALAQAALTAIGLWAAGVPAVGLLGFLTFLVAVIQLPTLVVWAPAALWLYLQGDTGWAFGLGLWGLLVVNTIDNILKPLLITQGARLPLTLIMLGVLGGLIAWGFIGIFLGPTLLGLAYGLFGDWLSEVPVGQVTPETDVAAGAVAPGDASATPSPKA